MPAPLRATPDRASALAAIVAALHAAAVTARAQASIARDEATGEESKQEGKYDTRAIEAGYLAQAQAKRLAEAELAYQRFAALDAEATRERVDGPCLVSVEDDAGEVAHYFVGPAAGGLRVDVDGAVVRVITPASPLGRSLLGLEADDELEDGRVVVAVR